MFSETVTTLTTNFSTSSKTGLAGALVASLSIVAVGVNVTLVNVEGTLVNVYARVSSARSTVASHAGTRETAFRVGAACPRAHITVICITAGTLINVCRRSKIT